MAFERKKSDRVALEGLDGFVQTQLESLSKQLSLRNAEDEANFSKLVLEKGMSLEEQLSYRTQQLARVSDDPAERRRVQGEVSALKQRVTYQKYADEYTAKLVEYETGISSIDSVSSWLKARKDTTTDQALLDKINSSLEQVESKRYELQVKAINDQTTYALNDKSDEVIEKQIASVTALRNKSLLSGRPDEAGTYDLQLQALTKAKTENQIAKDTKNFAVSTLTGYQNASGLLDSYNTKITGADANVPVTIGGVTYNSAKEYWTTKRDSYVADDSANGFFARFSGEQTDALKTRQSANLLSNDDLKAVSTSFDSLTGRSELASYATKINSAKQETLQGGADMQAKKIVTAYNADYDVNKAFASLQTLKNLGVNVDDFQASVLQTAAKIKSDQVSNVLQTAQGLIENGAAPADAIDQAVKAGAASTLSPTQLVGKTEADIAKEQVSGATSGTFGTDPRTTAASGAAKSGVSDVTPTPAPPIVTPQVNDVSSKYALVGKTVYDKATGKAFNNEQQFFSAAGVNSFQNLKFDQAYTPPPVQASTTLQQQPQVQPTPAPAPAAAAPKPTTYKVAAGDTLSAVAQRLLGDSKRYAEIAKLNNISDPNKISVGQVLNLPNK